MQDIAAYVDNLSDEALYKELKSYSFAAGPVVASTRRLYRSKLMQILENKDKDSDEIPKDEPSLQIDVSHRWSSVTTNSSPHLSYEQKEVPSRLNLLHSNPIYRHYEEDRDAKSHLSYLKTQDASHISNSSPLSRDSTPYVFRKSLPISGIRDEESFSRIQKTDRTILSRPDVSLRYRYPGSSEEYIARMARYNNCGHSKKDLRLMICGALVMATVFFLYILLA